VYLLQVYLITQWDQNSQPIWKCMRSKPAVKSKMLQFRHLRNVILYLIQIIMLQKLNQNGVMDRAAILLSGVCAVHCLVTAIFVAVVASFGGILVDPLIHEVGLVVAIVLGAIALGYGAIQHGFMMPLAIGSLGIGVMMGALQLPHGGEEVMFTLLGVTILALGHDLNYRATH